ncbi:MAG: cell division protein ZapA [Bacteroidaceae bacterium]
MNDISERFTINLQLGGQPYPITIKREDEIVYRDAAKKINGKLNLYKSKFPNQGNEKYMFMTLLDITVQLLRNENRNNTAPYNETLLHLISEIDEVLSKK